MKAVVSYVIVSCLARAVVKRTDISVIVTRDFLFLVIESAKLLS